MYTELPVTHTRHTQTHKVLHSWDNSIKAICSIWLTLNTMFLSSCKRLNNFIPLPKDASKVKKKKRERGYREKSQHHSNKIHKFFKLFLLFNSSVHTVTEVLSLCTNTSHVKIPLKPFLLCCRQLQGPVEYSVLFTVF